MPTFAMRGNKSRQVHASHSITPLEIRGLFNMCGAQPVGVDGGAPQWVADALETNPRIEEIKDSGVVYTRMSTERD